jgi:hypothetical protein
MCALGAAPQPLLPAVASALTRLRPLLLRAPYAGAASYAWLLSASARLFAGVGLGGGRVACRGILPAVGMRVPSVKGFL